MHVEYSGTAQFKVNATGQVISVPSDSLDWDSEGVDDRQMGPEVVYTAEADVGGHTVRWNLWEYPVGVENDRQTEVPPELTLIQDITYGLAHTPEDD
jgi:hypothetical protein